MAAGVTMMADRKIQHTTWNWKQFFEPDDLEKGKEYYKEGRVQNYEESENTGQWITAKVNTGQVQISYLPKTYNTVELDNQRTDLPGFYSRARYAWNSWNSPFDDERKGYSEWRCSCSRGKHWCTCAHMAAVMYTFADKHPDFFEVDETEEERDERVKQELQEEEEERQYKEMMKKSSHHQAVLPLLPAKPDKTEPFFDLRRLFKDAFTSEYDLEQLSSRKDEPADIKPEIRIENNEQVLRAETYVNGHHVTLKVSSSAILESKCSCDYYERMVPKDRSRKPENLCFCSHKIVVLKKLIDYVDKNDPGDVTDEQGFAFFKAFSTDTDKKVQITGRSAVISLYPRLLIDPDEKNLYLSAKASLAGSKPLIVRNIHELLSSWKEKESYALSRTVNLDFKQYDFTADSMPLVEMFLEADRLLTDFNEIVYSRSRYYDVPEVLLTGNIRLNGKMLDEFYSLYSGQKISAQNRNTKKEFMLELSPSPCRVNMVIKEKKDCNGKTEGISVSGNVPLFISSDKTYYLLSGEYLSIVSEEDEKKLKPFTSIADSAGNFHFTIGRKNLQEFYYRILPQLDQEDAVITNNKASRTIEKILPPEPVFSFKATLRDRLITIASIVSYDSEAMPLFPNDAVRGTDRDIRQEDRVLDCLHQITDSYDAERKLFMIDAGSDDRLYAFLTEGLERLSAFGIVQGNSAFDALKVRPFPVLKVYESVRFDSGLMDLSIKTKDMSPDELLALLASYRRKEKYHRLKSGDFISMENTEVLAEADDLMNETGLTLEEVIQKPQQLPVYRALYIDSLLEEHNDLAANRNAAMRSLLRSFRTVRDADYEVPSTLTDILRPYQTYGFQWLSVLAHTGFGGILADEMGLGKTLQYLALLYSLKLERENDHEDVMPSLVVAPASLVYNWKEEAEHFTPQLKTETIAGTQTIRKKQIAAMKDKPADLYITSYDLIKRDITHYQGIDFLSIVLDEAQYIKNAKTAAAKAVKTLSAKNRFALTGTPIENRLSELWSIFDFLMPGFLNTAHEFEQQFEIPVMKNHDMAAQNRLKKMVSPFILRRQKADVLKDLPPKLEEIRYALMGEDQQKLYDAQVVHMRKEIENTESFSRQKIQILAELTKLRQICCDPSLLYENYHGQSAKRQLVLELIRSAIDGGHRILLFSQFVSMLKLLKKDLDEADIQYLEITGNTAKEDRVSLVHQFNEGDIPVFLISLKAGGTGLNLTGADIVIHYDPWWNLAVQNQATDRAHRIGQTRQVTVLKVIAKDTIEEKIVELQNKKQDLADALVNGEGDSLMNLSREELLDLLS